MTDIRRHGFETDAQWREHLAEIEEATTDQAAMAESRREALRDLAGLRAEVASIRARILALPSGRRAPPWRLVGAGLFLLLLTAAGR